jgi:O-antigen/teichoic acid export membrane protein
LALDSKRIMDGPSLSLRSRAFKAGSWVLFGYFAANLIRLFGNLIIARLLSPEVFGIMAIAAVIQTVIAMFADLGIRQAVFQSRNGEQRIFLNTAWTLQIIRGCFVWGVCACAAVGLYLAGNWGWLPPDSVYATPVLPAVFAATSFSSVILGFESMKAITKNRNLDLKGLTLMELGSQIISLFVAITLSWLTHSVWAFVASGLTASMMSTVFSHLLLPGEKDHFAWDRDAMSELFGFGKWVFLSSAVGVLAMNGDRLLLAGWVTGTVLGYYSIAANLASVIESTASRVFNSVSLPALSEIARNQPERFSEVYFRMRWGADIAFTGAAGFLFAAGQAVIGFLYDARYAPAGQMLQWLSFGLLFARYGLAQIAYIALGKPNYLSAINFTKLISLFAVVPLFFYLFGANGAIIGICVYLAATLPLIVWFNHRHGLNNWRLELGVLFMWPIGWLLGRALVFALHGDWQ